MTQQLKIGAYAVLLICGLWFGYGFLTEAFENFIFDNDLEGAKDRVYEDTDKVWAKVIVLEAIQLMKDNLKDHPREQFVPLRIAEIYKKNLGNYLAAALEYEEIL